MCAAVRSLFAVECVMNHKEKGRETFFCRRRAKMKERTSPPVCHMAILHRTLKFQLNSASHSLSPFSLSLFTFLVSSTTTRTPLSFDTEKKETERSKSHHGEQRRHNDVFARVYSYVNTTIRKNGVSYPARTETRFDR